MNCPSALPAAPRNEAELLQRAQQLAGQSFAALAAQLGLPMPERI